MKIQCFKQTCAGQTDRQTDRVTPLAPDGAEKRITIQNVKCYEKFSEAILITEYKSLNYTSTCSVNLILIQ